MGPLLIVALALAFVVSLGGVIYPYWPFGRRWRAALATAAVLAGYGVSMTAPGEASVITPDAVATASVADTETTASLTR